MDPSDYARQRAANMERAADLRAQRRARGGGEEVDTGGDWLDELAGVRSEAPLRGGSGEKAAPKRTRREVAPGWTRHSDKKSGKPYYHHAASGKTTWVKPPGCIDDVENAPLRENGATHKIGGSAGAGGPRDVGDAHALSHSSSSRPRSDRRTDYEADARSLGSRSHETHGNGSASTHGSGEPPHMSEAEFENWLEVLKRRSLTGSQARRASTLLARYGNSHMDPYGASMDRRGISGGGGGGDDDRYGATSSAASRGGGTSGEGRSDSLSNLKLSMRSKRNKEPASEAELRTRSASEVLEMADGGGAAGANGSNGLPRGDRDAGRARTTGRRQPQGRRRPEWNDNFALDDDTEATGHDGHNDDDDARSAKTQPLSQNGRAAHQRSPRRRDGSDDAALDKPKRRGGGDDANLPEGWTVHTDRRTGNVFYRNEAKGESTWTRPQVAAEPQLPSATKPSDSESRHRTLWKPKSARRDGSDDEGSPPDRAYAHDRGGGRRGGGARTPPGASDDDDDDYSSRARHHREHVRGSDDDRARRESERRAISHGGGGTTSAFGGDDRDSSASRGAYGAVATDAMTAAPDGGSADLDDGCVSCGRAMTSKALDRMEKLHGMRCCPKCAPKKARKTFNAAAHRADAFDGDEAAVVKRAAANVKKELRAKERGVTKPKEGKWKAQSNQLREAMQAMRNVAAAEKSGKPLPPPVASTPDPSYVQCPHCNRTFNEKAAERHIPKCQSIKAKPKTLAKGGGRTIGRR